MVAAGALWAEATAVAWSGRTEATWAVAPAVAFVEANVRRRVYKVSRIPYNAYIDLQTTGLCILIRHSTFVTRSLN